MISVDKLSNYLNTQNEEIDEIKLFSIPQTEKEGRHIYDKYVLENKFEFLNKEIHSVPSWIGNFFDNKNYFMLVDNFKENTFCSSVLSCIMPDFRHLEKQSRRAFMRDLFKQMCYDLSEKKLYQEYGYNKNHKFSNQDLTKSLQTFVNVDLEQYFYVKQYLADYFSLNIYIFSKSNLFGKDYKIDCIRYNEDKNVDKINPTIFIVNINNNFYPIIEEDVNGVFLYTDHKDIIDKIDSENIESNKKNLSKKTIINKVKIKKNEKSEPEKNEGVKVEKNEEVDQNEEVKVEQNEEIKPEQIKTDKKENFNKMKLEELQNYAIEYGMDIYKISAKTNKKIKKTVKELREMLESKNN